MNNVIYYYYEYYIVLGSRYSQDYTLFLLFE
jgi:hypothetical protein